METVLNAFASGGECNDDLWNENYLRHFSLVSMSNCQCLRHVNLGLGMKLGSQSYPKGPFLFADSRHSQEVFSA